MKTYTSITEKKSLKLGQRILGAELTALFTKISMVVESFCRLLSVTSNRKMYGPTLSFACRFVKKSTGVDEPGKRCKLAKFR